jgi:apolipoprotein N-acyltransferase
MYGIRTSEIAPGYVGEVVGFTAFIIMVTSFSSGFVIFIFVIKRLKITLHSPKAILLIPSVWVLAEFLRAILFSIVSLGPSGRIGSYWTYGNLGYFLTITPLRFIGRIGGVYLLSFITVFIIVAILQKRTRFLLSTIAVLSILSITSWYAYKPSYKQPSLNVATANYPSTPYPELPSPALNKRILKDTINKVDVLILPEYSHYFEKHTEQDKQALNRIMKDTGIVIDSVRENNSVQAQNFLRFMRPNGEVLQMQAKWFTVPAGEYIPYIYQVILAYVGQERLLLDFRNQRSINPGTKIEQPYEYNGVRYGSLVCSGVTSPEFYRHLTNKGANILTNSASLGTLGVSSLFHIETQTMIRQFAVDNARPFVQAAKDGPSYIYNSDGRQIGSSTGNIDIVSAEVYVNNKTTLYTRFGNWILYAAAIMLILFYLQKWKNEYTMTSIRNKQKTYEKNKTIKKNRYKK